jgi:predicted glycosyltransferase
VREKVVYTGFIRRRLPRRSEPFHAPFEEPFILVTSGGGGDGASLVDRILAAYEADPEIPYPALVVYGPFMSARARRGFAARIERLPNVVGATFDAQLERLMQVSAGVVAMGGYNTFCEILSFDKPTLLVPRVVPRREQAIRAAKAEAAGLVTVLPIEAYPDTERMLEALAALPGTPPPSARGVEGLLDGLDVINWRVDSILTRRALAPFKVVGGN